MEITPFFPRFFRAASQPSFNHAGNKQRTITEDSGYNGERMSSPVSHLPKKGFCWFVGIHHSLVAERPLSADAVARIVPFDGYTVIRFRELSLLN